MTDIALTEWEHQPHVLDVLTSREMGAWLGRRDSRLLQKIRQEIESNMETITGTYDASTPEYNMPSHKIERNLGRKECIAIIGKHIKEIEDMGDYPDEIPNQFDNMTGSMNL